MDVVGSPPIIDHFDFNYGARNYLSAPSSPKRFGEFYLSAPTSPTRISELYSEFEYFSISSSNPFDLEHKPKAEDGFAFSVSGEPEESSRSAEELFDGGMIKPLKEEDNNELLESARSPLLSPKRPKRSPLSQGKKVIREAFSPRKRIESDDDNPFEARRGRDRTPAAASISSSESGRRATRSLSPYRISHHIWEEQQQQPESNNKEDITKASLSSTSSSKSSRKWRFMRDFLLFRSASEGRGSSKDPFIKHPILFKKPEEGKASSFRSSENPKSRRKEPISAHELHYARKKAETEDLKKRTFLPYKQGILGRLAGFGSLTR